MIKLTENLPNWVALPNQWKLYYKIDLENFHFWLLTNQEGGGHMDTVVGFQ